MYIYIYIYIYILHLFIFNYKSKKVTLRVNPKESPNVPLVLFPVFPALFFLGLGMM
jgi:hypothetical protein